MHREAIRTLEAHLPQPPRPVHRYRPLVLNRGFVFFVAFPFGALQVFYLALAMDIGRRTGRVVVAPPVLGHLQSSVRYIYIFLCRALGVFAETN